MVAQKRDFDFSYIKFELAILAYMKKLNMELGMEV